MIKVALADDQRILTDALAAVINNFDGYEVLYTAANGKELQQHISTGLLPDVLVLDLVMPEMDGYETAAWLQQHHPEVRILMLTMHDTDLALVRLLKYGVKGFVKKDAHPHELRAAIEAVATTGYYYNSGMAGRMAWLMSKEGQKPSRMEIFELTAAENAFLSLCCSELTYKEMARSMSISPSAVDNLRESLFGKLGVNSRIGLALYAVRCGMCGL